MAERKGMKINVGFYDKKHLRNLMKTILKQQKILDEAVQKGARIGESSGYSDNGTPFFFNEYPAVKARIDELLQELQKNLLTTIEEGNREEWLLSCEKNDKMVDAITSSTKIPKAQITQWKQPNLAALNAFQTRKAEGMRLSERVWNITEQFKEELELALDIGLGEGKSAAELSRDVRKYLNQPDKLFRRVRDKHGVLRLSKAAKAYHPGQGVYRSSYKNALRLTATENNMAYRTADHERWQQLDFVIGFEIKLSNNHPVYDICDELKGEYPKDFKFVGWHPHCRCFAVAITPDVEQFMEYQEKLVAGENLSNYKFEGEVKDVPDNFKEWMRGNDERLGRAKNIPYFIKDNPKYTGVAPRLGASSQYAGTKLGRTATKEAYKVYENMPKPTFTREIQENTIAIASEFGIKNPKPMTFIEANEGKGNIFYGKGLEYEWNCQSSVVVHEARLRGLDVTALGYDRSKNSVSYRLGERFQDIWEHPKTHKTPTPTNVREKTFGMMLEKLGAATKAPGRYHIGINMKGDGHVITAERLSNGRMIYYDAQSGVFIKIEEYATSNVEYFEILKVDKLLLRKDLFKAIAKVL